MPKINVSDVVGFAGVLKIVQVALFFPLVTLRCTSSGDPPHYAKHSA